MKHQSRWIRAMGLLIVLVLLAVALLPGSAVLAQEEGRFDVKFSGVIDAVGDTSWTVAGYDLAIGDSTRIRTPRGMVAEAGLWADVVAERLADDSLAALSITVRAPEMMLKGPVLAKPDSGLGQWTIAGQPFWVTEDTRISDRGGPVDVGYWVEVFAVEEADPTRLVATRMRGIEDQQWIQVRGAIEAFDADSWVLSLIPVAVDEDTLIAGDPQLGLLAQGEAELLGDDSLLALHLRPFWLEPRAGRPEVSLVGIIEELPPGGGFEGIWLVDGREVVVTDATVINEVKGPVEVGARVHVLGWQADGQVVAIRITVLACRGQQCGHMVRFRGPIEELPPHGPYGIWSIDGNRVRVERRTRLQGVRNPQIGDLAEVGAWRSQNGEMTALWLRMRPAPPSQADDTATQPDGMSMMTGSQGDHGKSPK